MKKIVLFFFVFPFIGFSQQDLTAKQIITKAEEKTRGTTSAYSEMTIITERPKWVREMSMKSWSKGQKFSLILITSPAKEKGTVFLKRDKEVWNWVPTIERTIKLPPSMMGQSWMGTDLTNDDLVKESSSISDYKHELLEDTLIDGKTCYRIEMIPEENAAVVWGKVIVLVDKKNFIQLRTEMYDEDETLVNVMRASEIKEMDGQLIATRLEFIPVEKKGNKTVIIVENMVFNPPIEDSFFTEQTMKKIGQ